MSTDHLARDAIQPVDCRRAGKPAWRPSGDSIESVGLSDCPTETVSPVAAPEQLATSARPPLVDISVRFRSLARQPAYRAVSSVMEQHILSGELKPGTALPPEQELAAQFGVNRSTIREAIRLLEQEGLLERHKGRRLFVVLPGLFDLAPRALRSLILHEVTFQELWEVAIVVEPEASRLAALRADVADLRDIDDNLAAAAETVGGKPEGARIQRHWELDAAFHALIARASKNRSLMMSRESFSLLYRPVATRLQQALPQSAARNLHAHRQIAAAVHARDEQGAHEWTRKHLVDFRKGFLQARLPIHAPADGVPETARSRVRMQAPAARSKAR
jgi:GntR family transcriptional regulator, transcriptional repressor for pyruvate dehydrogenase complex